LPRASVVIPTYNAATFVSTAYASLAAQTITDFEIIFVDDASQDDTVAVLRSFEKKDSRVRVIVLDNNQGPSKARNAALDIARGDWIAMLDADDFFAPDRLEYLVTTGKQFGADIILDNMYIVDPISKDVISLALANSPVSGFLPFVDFLSGIQGNVTYGFGFLKPVINRNWRQRHALRYRNDLRFGEDEMLLLDAFVLNAKVFLDVTPHYYYVLNYSLRTKVKSPNRRTILHYDRLVQASENFRARCATLSSPRSRQLLDRRCRLLRDVNVLQTFRVARDNGDLAVIFQLVCCHPIRLARGIYYSKRLHMLRRRQEERFRAISASR
jgi:succinoglycan biosynthesis protein ExoO